MVAVSRLHGHSRRQALRVLVTRSTERAQSCVFKAWNDPNLPVLRFSCRRYHSRRHSRWFALLVPRLPAGDQRPPRAQGSTIDRCHTGYLNFRWIRGRGEVLDCGLEHAPAQREHHLPERPSGVHQIHAFAREDVAPRRTIWRGLRNEYHIIFIQFAFPRARVRRHMGVRHTSERSPNLHRR